MSQSFLSCALFTTVSMHNYPNTINYLKYIMKPKTTCEDSSLSNIREATQDGLFG